MANTHSAEKRYRQSLKRRARNVAVKSEVKTAVKKARELIAAGDKKAIEAVRHASMLLDRAASKGVLHSKNASRRVARLAHNVSVKLGAAK